MGDQSVPPGEVAQIMGIQEERAHTYDRFEQGFRDHIEGGSDEAYEVICKESTRKFAEASTRVNEIETKLKALSSASADGLCKWIRKLQEAEKEKLYLTVALHVERKRAVQLGAALEALKPSTTHSEEHAHGCSCGGGDVAAQVNSLRGDSQELGQLQADKVRWMQKEMGQVVERVNEALDEIRYWDLD